MCPSLLTYGEECPNLSSSWHPLIYDLPIKIRKRDKKKYSIHIVWLHDTGSFPTIPTEVVSYTIHTITLKGQTPFPITTYGWHTFMTQSFYSHSVVIRWSVLNSPIDNCPIIWSKKSPSWGMFVIFVNICICLRICTGINYNRPYILLYIL